MIIPTVSMTARWIVMADARQRLDDLGSERCGEPAYAGKPTSASATETVTAAIATATRSGAS
jgi:hypothetical protein